MSTATVNFPPLAGSTPITEKGERIGPDALLALLLLFRGAPLQTVSTVAANANFGVPLAKFNQNVEIVYVKISNDVHTPTLVASGSDLINGGASVNMGTAQYSKLRLKSDGVSNWYVVG